MLNSTEEHPETSGSLELRQSTSSVLFSQHPHNKNNEFLHSHDITLSRWILCDLTGGVIFDRSWERKGEKKANKSSQMGWRMRAFLIFIGAFLL